MSLTRAKRLLFKLLGEKLCGIFLPLLVDSHPTILLHLNSIKTKMGIDMRCSMWDLIKPNIHKFCKLNEPTKCQQ